MEDENSVKGITDEWQMTEKDNQKERQEDTVNMHGLKS